MKRRLVIDGNEVYEIDEDCMLRKHPDFKNGKETHKVQTEKRKEKNCRHNR